MQQTRALGLAPEGASTRSVNQSRARYAFAGATPWASSSTACAFEPPSVKHVLRRSTEPAVLARTAPRPRAAATSGHIASWCERSLCAASPPPLGPSSPSWGRTCAMHTAMEVKCCLKSSNIMKKVPSSAAGSSISSVLASS